MTESLFSFVHAEEQAGTPKAVPLVVTLSGMNDPGGLVAQLDEFFGESCSPETLVRFNNDLLLDYRARRPMITFEGDHFIDYAPDELTLTLCCDRLGSPFLLLSGFEPDFKWERFVDAVLGLVQAFEVSMTVFAHGVPMPVPHTRPLRATVSGSRADLVEAHSVWRPTAKLPASMSQLLEYRLQSAGVEVVGFSVLVPHYLAGNEYPEALLFALDSVMSVTGLIFATEEVREAARVFRVQVDRQVAESEESGEMLRGLEGRYDSYMADQETRSPLIGEDGSIPTADELASAFERFLAGHHDDPPTRNNPTDAE